MTCTVTPSGRPGICGFLSTSIGVRFGGSEGRMLSDRLPLEELKGFWEEAASWGQLPVQLFVPLVKTVGIALICRTGSDLCRDAGESAIGSVLETAGAVAAIVVSLPLFRSAWELLRSLV